MAIFLSTNALVSAISVPQFQDGDRVCFVGDSITLGGSYHSYVYLYYLTRFPDREIRIFNKGVGGDRARDVLKRFNEDITRSEPTVSALMLGMNDIGRDLYLTGKDNAVKKQQHLDTYFKDMAKLIKQFEAIDSSIILITPSIYDETAELDQGIAEGANNALGKCSAFIAQTAGNMEQGYVDFYDAMLAFNTELQRDKLSATVVGPDRVHPRPEFGQFIMAYRFLKAQDVPRSVSEIVVDAQRGLLSNTVQACVSSLKANGQGVSFTALESALPYPQTRFIAEALEVVPFEAEMNQQLLLISGLDDGIFELFIDGSPIGSWTADQFANGINLATIEATPQYQQALKVKQLNDERYTEQSRLRNVAYVYFSSGLAESDVDLGNVAAVREFLNTQLKQAEGKSWYRYLKEQYENFFEMRLKQKELQERLNILHLTIYQANQPIAHQFRITKKN